MLSVPARTLRRMASRVCWYCKRFAHATRASPAAVTWIEADIARVAAMFVCDSCSQASLGIADDVGIFPHSSVEHAAWLEGYEHVAWFPSQGEGRDFPDVPKHVAEAASEAYQCQSINAHRGAVALARSVVEATAKEKGITQGRLVQKIDEMYAQGLIREHIKDGAHEVRHLGNDVAHGDFVDPVFREEADLVLTLMNEVLDDVFGSPARVAKAREAREARKQGGQGNLGATP